MADYYGTDKDEKLSQQDLALPDWTNIFGGEGNDTISGGNVGLSGGIGNDVLIGETLFTSAIYWDAPNGVEIDLRLGLAQDGFGYLDKLYNIRTVHGSRSSDIFIASDNGSMYFPNGGSDTIIGGNGYDVVSLYLQTEADFLKLTKEQHSESNSSASLIYRDQGQNYELTLSQIDEVTIVVANEIIKKYSTTGNIEETTQNPTKFFEVRTGEYLGNYAFERLADRKITATNLLTKESYLLGFDYQGISYKEQSFYFHQTAFSSDSMPWFHTIYKDPKSGSDVLILSTMSNSILNGSDAFINSSPTSVFVYGIESNRVKDLTHSFFATTPSTYWTRDIQLGDIQGDGLPDIFFSNQGREVGSYNDAPSNRVNPVWGERNQLFLGSEGNWNDNSQILPTSVDFSHGSSFGDFDGDGDDEILVNNLGSFDGFPNRYIVDWKNSGLVVKRLDQIEGITSTFTMAGDINHDGADDLVVGSFVFWGGAEFGIKSTPLPVTKNQQVGFINWHGGAVADLNGDGFLDIVKISASDGSPSSGVGPWQGLRFDLFLYSNGIFVDASANFSSYEMDQFGINISTIDIDFDGHLDILTSGMRYFYGQNKSEPNQFFFRNDGQGNFQLMKIVLDDSQIHEYFLRNNDGSINVISMAGSSHDFNYSSQNINPASVVDVVGPYGAGQSTVAGFDPQYYLNTYPEVRTAVSSGIYRSAVDHYLQVGKSEGKWIFAGGTTVWGLPKGELVVLRDGNERAFLREGDDSVQGSQGNDTLDGGDGLDTTVYAGNASQYKLALGGNSTSVADAVAGRDGTDTLTNIERLQFSDKTVPIESKPHGSYADLPDTLYQFFVVGFGAAPGVTYMDQMADAYRYWLPEYKDGTVKQIVEAFTTKTQFTNVYPQALYRSEGGKYYAYAHDASLAGNPLVKGNEVTKAAFDAQMASLAKGLVETIVKTSASEATKTAAATDVQAALGLGGDWTIGKVIYTVFGNLATKPVTDPVWGGTAKQFANQVAVAKYYTDTLSQSTDDVATLRSVMAAVSNTTDVSSNDAIASLIGVALLNGPGI